MNRSLLVFALFLILLGIGFNFYLLSFFGLLLMIPAFLSAPRPPMRPAPSQARQEVRRITPPAISQPEVALAQTPPKSVVGAPSTRQTLTYTPSLFPTAMFPSHTQVGTASQPIRETAMTKPEERDELLEIGTILALFKLALG